MKLYATTTSERASKGQGGNKFLNIDITLEDGKINAGHIEVKEIEPNVYNICYIKDWQNMLHIARIVTKETKYNCLKHNKTKEFDIYGDSHCRACVVDEVITKGNKQKIDR